MSTTARFHINRHKILEKLFNAKKMESNWRKVVKYQMRNLDIVDLHDYYDFNLYIKDKVKDIKNKILKGKYRACKPLTYKIEKKYGISRHLMIPSPTDALVFQTITNHIAKDLKKKQPSEKAFFSRDRNFIKLPHQYSNKSDDIWIELWKNFQKEIFKFSQAYDFLVVSDIANYFDNIGLRELRHVISSRFEIDEVILDILFKIVEELSWSPDYLPSSLKGLPTINIEAPRLLAHILLFEIDEVLIEKTGDSFVRWMDDLNFGVNDEETACRILGDINDVLKSRGLALNLSKTKIYTSIEAERHFLFTENKYLDDMSQKIDDCDYQKSKLANELEINFKKHLENHELKNWDKVTKRYFTIAGKIKSTRLLKYTFELFKKRPGIRSNIVYYLVALGYGKYTSELLLRLIKEVKKYDDIALFLVHQEIAYLLVYNSYCIKVAMIVNSKN